MTDMRRDCPGLDTLAQWVEGTLSPEARSGVMAHLSGCDACRRSVALAGSLDEVPGGQGTVNEVLLNRVVRASRRRPLWSWAAAAALLVALVLTVVLSQSGPESSENVITLEPDLLPGPKRPITKAPEVEFPEPPEPEPKPEPPKTELVRPDVPPRPSQGTVAKGDLDARPPKVPFRRPPHVAPKVPAVAKNAGKTEVNLDAVFTSVFVVDPTATLRLARPDEKPAAVSRYETVTRHDVFSAPLKGAAFTLEAQASVVLEKGAEVKTSFFEPDKAFALELSRGVVLIDTEGQEQNWRIARGGIVLQYERLNGQLAVEPKGEQRLAGTLLAGTAHLKIGATSKPAEAGREVVLMRDGSSEDNRGRVRDRLRRLAQLRPEESTAFEADFDKAGKVQPFPYTLVAGQVKSERTGVYLHGEIDKKASRPGRTICMAAIKPTHPFEASSGMVLRFRYRTTAESFTVRIGKYSFVFLSRRRGAWAVGRIPLSGFEHEGVMMVPSDRIEDVRFEGIFQKNSGQLDVDAVQFLRRAN